MSRSKARLPQTGFCPCTRRSDGPCRRTRAQCRAHRRSRARMFLAHRRSGPQCRATGAPRPDDIGLDAADATLALIALSAKMRTRPDRAAGLDRVDHRRCVVATQPVLLVDLGSELKRLGAMGDRRCRSGPVEPEVAGDQAGPDLQAVRPGAFRRDQRPGAQAVLGPSGKRPGYIAERVRKTWELGDGWAKHVTVEVALGTREGHQRARRGPRRPARRRTH